MLFSELVKPGAIMALFTPSGRPSLIPDCVRALDTPPRTLYRTVLDDPVNTISTRFALSRVIVARAKQPVSAMAEGPPRNAGGAGFCRSKRRYDRVFRLSWMGCIPVSACRLWSARFCLVLKIAVMASFENGPIVQLVSSDDVPK